uniref:Large ribosomal subunit protein bL21c n=1 Tax=Kuetzingia canaliculata TaxID=228262 RepID=A0A1Z1MNW0_KUECA|nr:ribosomal protein L21 [Kuetzingia canaliculata]ARW67787.1 ribosomal protein L21 [Kuetzingia canaliculata]
MVYAVIDIGGKQLIVEPGRFYDLNCIHASPGDIIRLNRVLFLSQSQKIEIGMPCVKDIVVRARILKHLKGKKLTVFKIKPKKNARSKKGHRQKLTRVLVEDIV